MAERSPLRLFGRRVRTLRKAQGWTQEELAERAELHENYISRLETGRQEPALLVILRLSRAFAITPAALLGDFSTNALAQLRLR